MKIHKLRWKDEGLYERTTNMERCETGEIGGKVSV